MSGTLKRRPHHRTVLWGKLAWHPAARAWREFAGDANEPASIEVLREAQKSATYRLVGAGPDGERIVAQRAQATKAFMERLVYEQVLPHLAVTAPRYYGSLEQSPEWAWLFLEDVGDERYVRTNREHLALAGRWVAQLHTTAPGVPAARRAPEGGPTRYLTHLRIGRGTIDANLANRALTCGDRAALERLASDLDSLEDRWGRLEDACTVMPATLAHGDFRPKNAHVRANGTSTELLPIDWEMAGWGAPAVDLRKVDLSSYWSVLRQSWPHVCFEDVQRLAAVGQVFGLLAGIRWYAPQLAYGTPRLLAHPMATLQALHCELLDAVGVMRRIS